MENGSKIGRRVFLAGLWQETNTFAAGSTGLDRFRIREGAELLDSVGDGSQLGAVVSLAEELAWEIVPGPYFQAKPAGIVRDEVCDLFLQQCASSLRSALAEGLDGILLFLHGAMVCESERDVEGAVLAAIARIKDAAKIPVAVVIDPHANVTPKMAAHCNILLSYRENPHTDAVETAVRACRLLDRSMTARVIPSVFWISTPLLWPPTGTASASSPMRPLLDLAEAEERSGIWAINVCPGFAHSDISDAGLSFTIVHDDIPSEKLEEMAVRFRAAALDLAPHGLLPEMALGEAIESGVEGKEFPCLLVEPADNVGGGAPGDGTWILRALLDRGVTGAGVILCDPEAVDQAFRAKDGEQIELPIGGKSSTLAGMPIRLTAHVIRKTDGIFQVEDKSSHTVGANGTTTQMGRSVLLESRGIKILLNSIKTMPVDLGQWKSMGVDPAELTFIGIKAAVAHRRAYDPIARRSFTVATPGPCASDLKSLPYLHIRRPVYPLDSLDAVHPEALAGI